MWLYKDGVFKIYNNNQIIKSKPTIQEEGIGHADLWISSCFVPAIICHQAVE